MGPRLCVHPWLHSIQAEICRLANPCSIEVYKLLRLALTSLTIWAVLMALVVELEDYGGIYTMFLVRLVSSLIAAHQLMETQEAPIAFFESVLPAICRWASTSFAALVFLKIVEQSTLLTALAAGCFFWDSLYLFVAVFRFANQKVEEEPKDKAS